jgi:hypothetical protein
MSTIFYQLICEINGKSQEGMRKMEVRDIEETYIPIISALSSTEKEKLINGINSVQFL